MGGLGVERVLARLGHLLCHFGRLDLQSVGRVLVFGRVFFFFWVRERNDLLLADSIWKERRKRTKKGRSNFKKGCGPGNEEREIGGGWKVK